jgi:hypothetical protein
LNGQAAVCAPANPRIATQMNKAKTRRPNLATEQYLTERPVGTDEAELLSIFMGNL